MPPIVGIDLPWFQITQTLIVLLLGAIARGVYNAAKGINRTFRRYGERLTDLEDWNHQNEPMWKDRLMRRRSEPAD